MLAELRSNYKTSIWVLAETLNFRNFHGICLILTLKVEMTALWIVKQEIVLRKCFSKTNVFQPDISFSKNKIEY